MKLNDQKCKHAASEEKPRKLFDGGGLYLEIMPTGSKLWRLKYRYGGKEKRLSFGKYPTITLESARNKRHKAKVLLSDDIDPAVARQEEKLRKGISAANTFEAVAREWLEKKVGEVKAKTHKNIVDRLEMNLFPKIGKLPIQSINAPILIEALKPIEKRGALDTLKRLRQYSSQIFRFAIAQGKATYNPAPDIIESLKTRPAQHFKAMHLEELPKFIDKIERNEVRLFRQTCLGLKLMILTFTRKAELSHARWKEMNFEDERWLIPAERMKMGKEHIIPLSKQALNIFVELKEMNGDREFVFPSLHKPMKPMNEDTLLRALYKLGYKGTATIHGFRSLAMTTIMEKLGYRYEVPDLQLAHGKGNKIRQAYDRTQFLEERTKMMQDWADYLDGLSSTKIRSLK